MVSISDRSRVLVFAAMAACGSVENQGDSGAPDTDAPAVVSISPADGTAGVTGDAEIVVVFSEPMDQDSVAAAWTSGELPAGEVSFTWNAAGDTLTAVPSQGLPLAEGEGTDPEVIDPLAFSIAIGTGATDLAGNPLAAAATTRFTTARRLSVGLAPIQALTRTMNSDGTVFGETDGTLRAGDDNAGRTEKIFVSFQLPALPAGAALESAELVGNQTSANADVYSLGALRTLHTSTADTLDLTAFSQAPLARLEDFSVDGTPGARSVVVAGALADDLANRAARNDRTQYRLEFETGTNNNNNGEAALFSRSGFGLTAIYLVD